MKIYTKTGDKGETSLLGGTRVPKHHLRIECYGTVDELNSWIGLVRAGFTLPTTQELLNEIQNNLFVLGSHLATDPAKTNVKIPELEEQDITNLERAIDEMDKQLPPLKNFVLPGGSVEVAHSHLARCVCRRAERLVTQLSYNEAVNPVVLRYLNRLSDYLFTLGRFITYTNKVTEIPWVSRS
jgi:cob(I)alamin adenosyltransferase